MTIILIAVGAIIVIWLVSSVLMNSEKKRRDEVIKKHLEEKAKEKERQERFGPPA